MTNLQGLVTILVLALAVVPFRIKRYFSKENRAHLAVDLAVIALGVAIVLLGLGVMG